MGEKINSVLLYGGTFDPIHMGHLISVSAVADHIHADRIILVPSAVPPHKQSQHISTFEHRYTMAELAVAGDSRFRVSDCESHRQGPSFTIDTVQYFRNQYGSQVELCWLIGADSLGELPGWHQAATLVTMCRIVTARRPGWPTEADMERLSAAFDQARVDTLLADQYDTPLIDLSGTYIRQQVLLRRSIRYMVPTAVAEYIRQHGLYVDDQSAAFRP